MLGDFRKQFGRGPGSGAKRHYDDVRAPDEKLELPDIQGLECADLNLTGLIRQFLRIAGLAAKIISSKNCFPKYLSAYPAARTKQTNSQRFLRAAVTIGRGLSV
jgi:hypothetical protein